MRFFVPEAKDDTQAQAVWEATKRFAEENLKCQISERRIFSITYHRHGEDYYVEVGKPDPRTGEPVLVILESNPYLICTPNRGVLRGIPILVGHDTIERILDFQN